MLRHLFTVISGGALGVDLEAEKLARPKQTRNTTYARFEEV